MTHVIAILFGAALGALGAVLVAAAGDLHEKRPDPSFLQDMAHFDPDYDVQPVDSRLLSYIDYITTNTTPLEAN